MTDRKRTPLELPSQEELLRLLDYNPETGILVWKIRPAHRVMIGDIAGSVDSSTRYLQIRIKGVLYYSHRLIWKIVTGKDPVGEIDHENGNRQDNRFQNLRDASKHINSKNKCIPSNNYSGVIGVTWHQQGLKWCAAITENREKEHLGLFDNIEDAAAARKLAEKAHAFHDNHGREPQTFAYTPAAPKKAEYQSGAKGITWRKREKKWATRYQDPETKVKVFAGLHDTVEQAIEALEAKKRAAGLA